jgi:hypothetical protein
LASVPSQFRVWFSPINFLSQEIPPPPQEPKIDRDQFLARLSTGSGTKKYNTETVPRLRRYGLIMGAKSTGPREIAELNIQHFTKLLQTPLDERTRATVARLLAEEKAKLAKLSERQPPTSTGLTPEPD